MSQRLSETVFRVLQLSKPTFVNGRWRKPAINRRELAEMKKYLLELGAEWPEKKLRNRGGDKPYKLTKLERGREARQAAIAENMAKMPQMIADYRKKVYDLREAARKKNRRTEEEEYMLATGKKTQEEPAWQVLKDAARRK